MATLYDIYLKTATKNKPSNTLLYGIDLHQFCITIKEGDKVALFYCYTTFAFLGFFFSFCLSIPFAIVLLIIFANRDILAPCREITDAYMELFFCFS